MHSFNSVALMAVLMQFIAIMSANMKLDAQGFIRLWKVHKDDQKDFCQGKVDDAVS